MSGCKYHVGQFDRTCCSGKPPEKLDGYYTMTNYFVQVEIAAEMMKQLIEEHPEFSDEWETWDWL